MKKYSFLILAYFSIFYSENSSAQTIGLFFHNSGTEDGYVLFAPNANTKTYLIDKCGKQIHSWTSAYTPGLAVYLLPNGKLLRAGNTNNSTFNNGGKGGIIELLDTNSSVLWSYLVSNNLECQHHDIYPLANGNILAIVWEKKTQTEAISEGRNPALLGTSLWTDKIIEIQPTGSATGLIVWEWHVWDHLIQDYSSTQPNFGSISQHPELINLNYYTGTATQVDWLHINAIAYNPTLDQIMISCHNFSEIWIIDHSTTSSQSASHTLRPSRPRSAEGAEASRC